MKKHHIGQTVAFVNAGRAENSKDGVKILEAWVKDGNLLGNHTWSHPDLNNILLKVYIDEIARNDAYLKHYGSNFLKFFRYPFLHEGNTQEKRDSVRTYLAQNEYIIAQVTLDFSDWVWNAAFTRCLNSKNYDEVKWLHESFASEAVENLKASRILSEFLFDRQIKHIALIHPFALSVELLDIVITSWEKKWCQVYYLNRSSQGSSISNQSKYRSGFSLHLSKSNPSYERSH